MMMIGCGIIFLPGLGYHYVVEGLVAFAETRETDFKYHFLPGQRERERDG